LAPSAEYDKSSCAAGGGNHCRSELFTVITNVSDVTAFYDDFYSSAASAMSAGGVRYVSDLSARLCVRAYGRDRRQHSPTGLPRFLVHEIRNTTEISCFVL